MNVITERIKTRSEDSCGISDITGLVVDKLSKTGMKHGNVTIFVEGATGGVTTLEHEPGLLKDLPELFEKLIPSDKDYHHDKTWGDGNGFSHLRSALIGPSVSIPFIDGTLTLGTWQQIIVLNFDNRPRSRQVLLQFIGE
ncbi:MAG: YjbQ family protein [candidate division Zixibacteria bacterium]|nr:YjbQ family protein [candidate division Zixibacteria bacterium]